MMKKKISILTLAALFLVSTTGLPVSYHLCQMMDEKSLGECEVCKVEMEKIEPSCCSKETPDYPVKITSENPVCCQEEFVYNKVEDEFLYVKSDLNYFSSSQNSIQPIDLIPQSFNFSVQESYYCDSSPPFLINPELHITNSILLI
jgi:predicted molibdopterin-dependent oxidoreductase YjgC